MAKSETPVSSPPASPPEGLMDEAGAFEACLWNAREELVCTLLRAILPAKYTSGVTHPHHFERFVWPLAMNDGRTWCLDASVYFAWSLMAENIPGRSGGDLVELLAGTIRGFARRRDGNAV